MNVLVFTTQSWFHITFCSAMEKLVRQSSVHIHLQRRKHGNYYTYYLLQLSYISLMKINERTFSIINTYIILYVLCKCIMELLVLFYSRQPMRKSCINYYSCVNRIKYGCICLFSWKGLIVQRILRYVVVIRLIGSIDWVLENILYLEGITYYR